LFFDPAGPILRPLAISLLPCLLPHPGISKSTPNPNALWRMGRQVNRRFQRCLKRGANMATGTVKFFNAARGFGFIAPDDGGKDVFVHVTAVERAGLPPLVEGQKIRFEVTTERGKTAATNLQRA